MIDIIKLSNNIKLINDFMPDVETVSIKIVVKTGSRNESVDNNGISHFIEHMAFKGTNDRTAKQIACDFENIGAQFNAYTSKECTAYYVKVLKEYSSKALEILVDMFENSNFNNEELEKERGVILQELAMTNDSPDDMIYDYYMETAFPNQAYGRTILGPAKNIENFKQKDFFDYINKNYIEDRIVVSVSGNIEIDKIVDIANKLFKKNRYKSSSAIEKANYIGGYFKKEKDLEQVQCILGFDGVSYNDNRKYKMSIMSYILGGGMSSRLFQEVRENKGLCYSVYSYNESSFDVGSFQIYTAIDPKNTNKAIDAIIDETKKMANSITDEELLRAKIKIKSSILMGLENTSNRASSNASEFLRYGRIKTVEEIVDEIERINKIDVLDILKETISTSPSIALYGKLKNVYDYEYIKNKMR